MKLDNKIIIAGVLILIAGIIGLGFWQRQGDTKDVKIAPVMDNQLKIVDEVVGTGDEAVAGNKITVNYRGTLLDGTEFDSSYKRNQPFEFTLGAGEVIAGWDQGFAGMKVGGKRKLTIPSDLGYGSRGAGASIPPNSTLIFEVELLNVQ